jgi:hypothetical protein
MDAEKVISRIRELQDRYGKNINILVDHEEIMIIAYFEPLPQENQAEYVNIGS